MSFTTNKRPKRWGAALHDDNLADAIVARPGGSVYVMAYVRAMTMIAQLIDDDGVLVLASAKSLAQRFAGRSFDYAFPKELVEGAAVDACCAWQTNEEGDVLVSFHADEGTVPPEARYVGSLQFG